MLTKRIVSLGAAMSLLLVLAAPASFAESPISHPAVLASHGLDEALRSSTRADSVRGPDVPGNALVLEIASAEASASASAGTVRPALAIGYITCSLWSESPHYSRGAWGAIFKVRGTCTRYGIGMAATVKVYMNGTLTKDGAPRATRSGVFAIPTDGTKATWYVPYRGSGGSGCGTWRARNVVTSVVPSGLSSGVVFSKTREGCLMP